MRALERASAWYFCPKAFESDGRIYEWLGVLLLKRLLVSLARSRRSTWAWASGHLLHGSSRAAISAFERRTRRNEAVHLMGLMVGLIPLAAWLVGGGPFGPVAATALGAVGAANLHPVILQRYNRARLLRVLARRGRPGGLMATRARSRSH